MSIKTKNLTTTAILYFKGHQWFVPVHNLPYGKSQQYWVHKHTDP